MRSTFLSNFLTLVFGTDSMKVQRSGSHQCDLVGQEVAELVRGGLGARAEHDAGERSLVPALVRDGDDGRLEDGRVPH